MSFTDKLRRHRKAFIALGVAIVFVAGGLVLLPYAIRYGIVTALEDDAGQRRASIADVDYNPFTGRLTVTELQVTAPGNRGASLQRLFVELDNSDIWRQRIHLLDIVIDGAVVDIGLDDGLSIGGIPVGGAGDERAGEQEEDSDWRFGIGQVTIRDSRAVVHSGGETQTLEIRSGDGSPFLMWAAEDAGDVSGNLALGGGTLRFSGTVQPFGAAPGFELSLKGDQVAVGPLLSLWAKKDRPEIETALVADMTLRGSFGDEGPRFHVGGSLNATDFRMTLPRQSGVHTAKALSLTGMDITLTPDSGIGISINGEFQGNELRVPVADGTGNAAIGSLSLTASKAALDIGPGGAISGNGGMTLSADGISAPLGSYAVDRGNIDWNGSVTLNLREATTAFTADGTLNLETVALSGASNSDTAAADSVGYTGRVVWTGQAEGTGILDGAGTLTFTGLALRRQSADVGQTLQLDKASIDASNFKATVGQGGSVDVQADTTGTADGLRLERGWQHITQDGMAWDTKSHVALAGNGGTSVAATGNAESLTTALTLVDGTRLSWQRLAVADLDTTAELAGDRSEFRVASTTTVVGMKGAGGGAAFENENLTWAGTLQGALPSDAAAEAGAEGRLESGKLSLTSDAAGMDVTQDSAVWDGKLTISIPTDGPVQLTEMQGRAESGPVAVVANGIDGRLLQFALLRVIGLHANEGVIGARVVSINEIAALRDPAEGSSQEGSGPITLSQLQLEELTANPASGRMEAETVTLDGAEIRVERRPDGSFARVDAVLPLFDAPSGGGPLQVQDNDSVKNDADPAAPPVSIRFGSTAVVGNSRIVFTDRSVSPAVQLSMSPVAITLSAIDSAKPESAADLSLSATISKYTVLTMSGTVKPFKSQLTLDLDGSVNGFDLTEISGYAAQFLGYELKRGRLDAEIKAKIVEGKIDTASTLVITKLSVDPADPSQQAPLQNRIEVPLETALALLRRDDDVIRLNVPVSGDLANPQFDFSDGINQAIGGAIRSTVTTLFKVAFPIGGAIKIIADAAGNRRLQIDPVVFPPGIATLPPPERAHLDEVEKFLLDRPEAKMTLCGHATAQDRDAMLASLRASAVEEAAREKPNDGEKSQKQPAEISLPEGTLLDLARSRSEAVKDELLSRDGIAENRLFLCAPEVSLDNFEAEPRVDLQF